MEQRLELEREGEKEVQGEMAIEYVV